MNNIYLTEPLIIVANKTVETGGFLTDPTFIISSITLLLTISALCFSVIIFRPKVHIELKNVLFKPLLKSYEIVISNNGNVMAEDITIEFDDGLKKALNNNCPSKNKDDFGSFKFIESNLKKEFKYLPANKEVKGLFITVEKNNSNTSPLLFGVPFTVYVTYTNSITRWKYKKQPVILELKESDWITDYHMNDNLGYDLSQILDKLEKTNNTINCIHNAELKIINFFETKKNKMQKKFLTVYVIKRKMRC